MYCVACGAENPATARCCVNCGAGLTTHCSQCQSVLPTAARFCPACGKPAKTDDAQPAKPTPVSPGERKQVTVLFADFAGYTAFAHGRDAEDVRDYMTSMWARLDSIITAHGGVIEKHIGDAVMAMFGAKQAREEDPVQAVRAALAMQAALGEFKPEAGQPVLQLRIGIHTGLVVAGPLGTSGEFAITGDAVNLASRLEENAPPGSVVVSHETHRHVSGLFDVQALPPFRVDGRPEAVRAFIVLRAKPRGLAVLLRGVEGVKTEMIGRERELNQLQSALQRVMASGESQALTIAGDAGIGKSCLLREFQQWLEFLPETVRFLSGRATAESAHLPFSVMRDMFSVRFEIQDSDPSAVAREKLERGIVGLLGDNSGNIEHRTPNIEHRNRPADAREELDVRCSMFDVRCSPSDPHFIGQLLGLDFSSSPHLRDILNDADQIRHRAFQAFTRIITAVSRGDAVKAAVLIVEDIHWADKGSLDLLVHLSRSCARVPLLIVCLARPALFERQPGWGAELSGHTRVDLEPLSRKESLALVESILRKAPQIPQALRELIVGGAEGVPFYIEELIKMLIDQNVIVPGGDQWHVEPERLAAARVPPTLTGILQARLDGLLPAERLVLQRASVVGRIFWDSGVERLDAAAEPSARLGRREVLEALAGLRRKELIFRRESSAFAGAEEYLFKHELLRNVAYESLLRKSRRGHHAEIAGWLIEHSGERSGEVAGLVATHFEQAERLPDAAVWYGRAGQQARAAYAPAAAIDYFRKALSLPPAPVAAENGNDAGAKRLEWHEGLVEVLGAQARFAEALETCTELRRDAEASGDRVTQARAWNGLAFLNERLGKNRASIECAERAEALARDAADAGKGERIRALLLKGWAFYRLSDAAEVLALGEQARALCLESGHRTGLATSFKLRGVANLQLGHYPEADRLFEEGLALYQELGDRRNAASMWNNLAAVASARGDHATAAKLYETALAAVRDIGHRESEGVYLTNLSSARVSLEKFELAEAASREAIALTDGANFCALSSTYSFLSEALLGQGRLNESLEAARRGLKLAQESENDLDLGIAWRALGQVATAWKNGGDAGSFPAAGSCFGESLRVFRKINAEGEEACTLRAWAECERRQGRVEEARRKAEAARSIFERLGAAPEVARTDAWLGGVK